MNRPKRPGPRRKINYSSSFALGPTFFFKRSLCNFLAEIQKCAIVVTEGSQISPNSTGPRSKMKNSAHLSSSEGKIGNSSSNIFQVLFY